MIVGLTKYLTAGIVNGVLVLVTFVLTLPAIALPTRGWLKLSGYLIVINAVYSVVLGLYLWISTLRTKESFSPIWNAQSAQVQDFMQTSVCALPKNHPMNMLSSAMLRHE